MLSQQWVYRDEKNPRIQRQTCSFYASLSLLNNNDKIIKCAIQHLNSERSQTALNSVLVSGQLVVQDPKPSEEATRGRCAAGRPFEAPRRKYRRKIDSLGVGAEFEGRHAGTRRRSSSRATSEQRS